MSNIFPTSEYFEYTGNQVNTVPQLSQDAVKDLFAKFYVESLPPTSITIELNTLRDRSDVFISKISATFGNRNFLHSGIDDTAIKALNKAHDMLAKDAHDLVNRRGQRRAEL
ncbi:MAG: hypothetical protein MUQ75_10470 [Crocinitomicaceae bacterium]|nr:hypothetical protein [Crocinitomicaceae bacterium]